MHYSRQPTYLAPEISYFNTVKDSSKKDINVKVYPELFISFVIITVLISAK